MKPIKLVSLSVIAACVISMLIGCNMFRRTPPPLVPPPVTVQGSAKGAPAKLVPNFVIKRMTVTPAWYEWSVFYNLMIYKEDAAGGSGGSVLATNHYAGHRIAFQISDCLIGTDLAGEDQVVVIDSGESYSIKDPNMGPRTRIRALIIDGTDKCLGYIPLDVRWMNGEAEWNIVAGGPIIPLPKSPMILLPARSAAQSGGPTLSTPSAPPAATPTTP